MSTFNQKEKFWYGPELNRNSIFNPNNGVGEVILEGLKSHLNQISQINDEDGTRLTCKDILERSIGVAENLNQMGFKQGDVISVISRNNEDLAPAVFGCMFLGATLNTLDVTLDESDLTHILGTVKPKLLFVDPVCLVKVQTCLINMRLGTKLIIFDSSDPEYLTVRSLFTIPDRDASQSYMLQPIVHPTTTPAFVLCTSGITGPNRMVCLSHSQVISEVLRLWDWSITSSDITFNFSSLFWVSGLANLLIATIKGACRIITTKPYSSDMFLDLIPKYKITQMCLPNACIPDVVSNKKMEEIDFSSLKFVLIGGSVVYDQTKQMLRAKLQKYGTKVIEVYGFIEIGSLVANTLHGMRDGSCGIVASQNLIKIINDKGKSLGPNEIGEICGKCPCKFLGYYNNEELTKQSVDSNGWIRSGDLGYFDDDGYLYLKGRIKELIKCNGSTISPESIESTIQQKLGLNHVCAIGIEDGRSSDDLPAIVIKLPSSYPFTEEQVIEMANEALPDDCALKGGVYFVNDFPMTPSGKVKRGALKKLANDWYKEQLKKLEKERRKHEPAPMYFLS